jgi:hypothetical protein
MEACWLLGGFLLPDWQGQDQLQEFWTKTDQILKKKAAVQ